MALNFKKSAAPVDGDAHVNRQWPSPVKPSAMLVPRYVIENNAAASTRRTAILAVGGFALVVTVVVAAVFFMALSAKSTLTEAEGARDSMKADVDRLSPIAAYYDGLDQRRAATIGLLTTDIDHARLLSELRDAMPSGATFTSYSPVIGTPCPGPDPFNAPQSLGCITVQVNAPSQAQAAALVSNITSDPDGILADPFVSNVSDATGSSGGGATFSVSLNFTSKAYSGKYAETVTPPGSPGGPSTPSGSGAPSGPTGPSASGSAIPQTPTTDESGAQ